MTAHEVLWEAQDAIGRYWKEELPPTQTRLLGLARDALDFLSVSGQRHRFHDYRQRRASSAPQAGAPHEESVTQSTGALLMQAEGFFTNLLSEARTPDEAEQLQAIVDALHFITATGQQASLEEYLEHLDAGSPPYVVAAFNTEAEAEAWLMSHLSPPDFAHIIVAGEYRTVHYDPENNLRSLPNDHALEYYLAELQREEPPTAVAAFDTREDADAWLKAQPTPARRAWVLVGGKFYLAAYYANIHHRALFPLSRGSSP
jgi:hypothetical protein